MAHTENAFGDSTEVRVNSLRLHSSKEELWRFDLPKDRVASNRWSPGNIIQAIKDHSESMLALVQI